MPEWAKKRGISQDEWNSYLSWLKSQYSNWKENQKYEEYYNRFVSYGKKPTPTEVPVTTPEKPTEKPTEEEPTQETYVPGRVSFEPTTGKYYDLTTGLTLTREQADQLLRQYNEAVAPTPTAVPQWRIGERELEEKQFGFQKEQFAWQQQQAQQQIAQSYEDWRRRLLGELTEPSDWITRWMVEQTPEKYPWQPPPRTEYPEIALLEGAIAKRITEMRPGPPQLLEVLPELEHLITMEKELQGWQTVKEQATTAATKWPKQPTPESILAGIKPPPAPEWLPQYVPGLQAGQAITRQFMPTPSGQQLTQLAPSRAAALSGYAEWSKGRPWRDVLAQAELMAPRTPSGAGAVRWRPVRQGAV